MTSYAHSLVIFQVTEFKEKLMGIIFFDMSLELESNIYNVIYYFSLLN